MIWWLFFLIKFQQLWFFLRHLLLTLRFKNRFLWSWSDGPCWIIISGLLSTDAGLIIGAFYLILLFQKCIFTLVIFYCKRVNIDSNNFNFLWLLIKSVWLLNIMKVIMSYEANRGGFHCGLGIFIISLYYIKNNL